MKPMSGEHPDPKVLFTKQLKMRVNRFQRLIEIDAPDIVIAREFGLIYRAMCALYPQATGQRLSEIMAEHNYMAYGYCIEQDAQGHYCGKPVQESDAGYCPQHDAELKALNAELDEELDEEPEE